MKIKTLLAKAARCTDSETAGDLCQQLMTEFESMKRFAGLKSANPDWAIEPAGPFFRFELNWAISGHYILMVRPEVRDGKFGVAVEMQHMLDGKGLHSLRWEAYGDGEAYLEAQEQETLHLLAKRVQAAALGQYAALLESVGLPKEMALKTASAAWNANNRNQG